MKIIKRCFNHPLRWIITKLLFSLLVLTNGYGLYAQGSYTVQGRVVDSNQDPLPGVNIIEKGTINGAITGMDGKYTISVAGEQSMIIFSFIGYLTEEVAVGGRSNIDMILLEDIQRLDEVVVVGFGRQKKESVVGAISQTTGETLERAGGVSSVGAALTGNLPGVITTSSSGMPGAEDPRILIRAASTWNNSAPLILVDGVERELNSVDINSVESISVLKDASATAVFGVQGANGVILITTKRGVEGKAIVSAGFNTTVKTASKLPNKYDAYDALLIRNKVIEYELASNEDTWQSIRPYDIIRKYRHPADATEKDRYPNIDWQEVLFEDYTMSYSGNVSVSGGTESVRYFANVDYVNEGDLFKEYQSSRAYKAGFGYDRVNMRSNMDFKITSSTLFKVNIAGSYGKRKGPWNNLDNLDGAWTNAYNGAPDLFQPQYSNGMFGFYGPQPTLMTNSVRNLAISGIEYQTTTNLTTDFVLEQDLGMFIKGLSVRGAVSIDNRFREAGRGVDDRYTEPNLMWVDPITGEEHFMFVKTVWEGFDYPDRIQWSTPGGSIQNWRSYRRADYSTQLNYANNFGGRHDVNAMGVFERKQYATGNEILRVRENWVFRTTYAFDKKYTIEYNGAYNGSEKFAKDYRFAFFSSGGVGWMISEENFMSSFNFLDILKLRASYGKIGDDSFDEARWLYMDQWSLAGRSAFRNTGWDSGNNRDVSDPAYINGGGIGEWYKIIALGNPDLQWEEVTKTNIGVDFGIFRGLIRGNIDFFHDVRDKILVDGDDRAVPAYFGAKPPVANIGKVRAQGYELELKFNKRFMSGMRLWADMSMTHAENKILVAEEAELLPDYMKKQGKMVNQTMSYLNYGYYNSWDELYATTKFESNDIQKLPGNYYIMDYNADGVIDENDEVPYSYPTVPQNTYTTTVGFEWKGFSTFVQLYGASNVTRPVYYNSFANNLNSVFDEGSMWSKDNPDPDVPIPAWERTPPGAASGQKAQYDASYLRIKNAEIAYTFDQKSRLIKSTGLSSVRIYLNGNNLWIWTKMPDDRESNFATTNPGAGAYPTVKRFNLGINLIF